MTKVDAGRAVRTTTRGAKFGFVCPLVPPYTRNKPSNPRCHASTSRRAHSEWLALCHWLTAQQHANAQLFCSFGPLIHLVICGRAYSGPRSRAGLYVSSALNQSVAKPGLANYSIIALAGSRRIIGHETRDPKFPNRPLKRHRAVAFSPIRLLPFSCIKGISFLPYKRYARFTDS